MGLNPEGMKLDSPEGIEYFAAWARAHKVVLNLYHEKLMIKHGIPTEGIMFARPLLSC